MAPWHWCKKDSEWQILRVYQWPFQAKTCIFIRQSLTRRAMKNQILSSARFASIDKHWQHWGGDGQRALLQNSSLINESKILLQIMHEWSWDWQYCDMFNIEVSTSSHCQATAGWSRGILQVSWDESMHCQLGDFWATFIQLILHFFQRAKYIQYINIDVYILGKPYPAWTWVQMV